MPATPTLAWRVQWFPGCGAPPKLPTALVFALTAAAFPRPPRPPPPQCHWVEECGAPRPAAPRPLFDLEPPHKGLARARDADGWFPLRATRGATTPPPSPSSACEEELYPGARFSSLEPFYNGTALAVRSGTGERVLLRDDGGGGGCCVAEPLGGAARDVAPAEHAAALHGLCVSPWPGLALRAGLAAGLAGEGVRGALLRLAPAAAAATARQPPPVVADALARAWRSMGLLERDSDDGGADVGGCGAPPALSPRGLLLAQPGGAAQAKAAFWLGDAVVGAWAAGAALPQAAPACGDPPPASPASASSALVPLFSDPAVQAALDAHADDDGWGDPSGLAAALWRLASPPPGCGGLRDSSPPPQQPLPDAAVDVGGGLGRLAAALKAARPGADVVLAELPAVAALAAGRCAAAGVAVAAANLLAPSPPPSPPLPPARLFVLVRVLHDHRDAPALALLRAVRTCAPAGALLAVVERGTGRGGGCDGAGLLSLHLALMRGTVERGGGEWRRLLGAAVPGWRLQGGGPVPFGGQDTWLLRAS